MEGESKVFRLIKGLSRSEKRYFKVTLANGNGKNLYVELFNVLDKMKTYQEEVILEKVKDIKRAQLENHKSYLYRKLLNALTTFHGGHFETIQIRQLMSEAEVLLNKGFNHEALEILSLAERRSKVAGLESLAFETMELMGKIYILQGDFDKWEGIIKTRYKQVQVLSHGVKYSELNNKIFGTIYRQGALRSEEDLKLMRKYFMDEYLQDATKPITDLQKCTYHYLRGTFFYLKGDYTLALDEAWSYLDYAKKVSDVIKKDSNGLIVAYDFVMAVLLKLGKVEEALKLMEEFDSVEIKSKTHETWKGFVLEFRRLEALIKDLNFQEAYELVLELTKRGYFDVGGERRHKIQEVLIRCAYVTFVLGKYSESLSYLNLMNHEFRQQTDENLFTITQVLLLITHYEIGNDQLVRNQISRVYRYLKRKDRLFEYEKLILRCIKEMTRIESERELSVELDRIRGKLREVMQNPMEAGLLEVFDLESWIESKISRRPMIEVLQSQSS